MKCPNCGKVVPDTARVCGYCGQVLPKDQQPSGKTEYLPAQTRKFPSWLIWVLGLGGGLTLLFIVMTVIKVSNRSRNQALIAEMQTEAALSGTTQIALQVTPTLDDILTQATPSFTIGISNAFISSEYRTQMINELIETNAGYMGIGLTEELVIESFDTDVTGQISQIERLINFGVDALLVVPSDATSLNPILAQAVNNGILVISINQEVNVPGVINIGHDEYEWAWISAQWFAGKLQEGEVVLIEGVAGHPANDSRMQAVLDAFADYPEIDILATEQGFWDEDIAKQVMADFLKTYPNLDGCWTQEGMAIGVLEAVIAATSEPMPIIVGEARVQFLQLWAEMLEKDPNFETIAVANAPGVGATALRIAVELLQGKPLTEDALQGQYGTTIIVPISIVVTPENFETVYAQYKDYPGSTLLSSVMTREEVLNSFFGE